MTFLIAQPRAVIRAAEEKGCDLIVMASHGRRGVQGFLIGSETHKVLTPSRTPVLVYRYTGGIRSPDTSTRFREVGGSF